MNRRWIGGVPVGAMGFGAMWLSARGRPSEGECVAAIHAALDVGITLIDTADVYGLGPQDVGHNERLVARALREYGARTDHVLIATKGGHCWPAGRWGVDGRPQYLRSACEASLERLGVETIDLYQFHRPDPAVPIEESVGALVDLQREGKVRMVGLSNVSLAHLTVARRVTPVASVQNPFNLFLQTDAGNGLLAACEAEGTAYLAYEPLAGRGRAGRLHDIPGVSFVARRHGISPQEVVLAWELARSPVLIPIPGARHAKHIRDDAAAAEVRLSDEERALVGHSMVPRSWHAEESVQVLAHFSRRAGRRLARTALRR